MGTYGQIILVGPIRPYFTFKSISFFLQNKCVGAR